MKWKTDWAASTESAIMTNRDKPIRADKENFDNAIRSIVSEREKKNDSQALAKFHAR